MVDAFPNDNVQSAQISPLRLSTGILLIVLSLTLGGWFVFELIDLLDGSDVPPIVAALAPEEGEPIVIEGPQRAVTVPLMVFKPVGYLLVCLIYAILAGMAGKLLSGGVSLLQPDMRATLERLTAAISHKR